MKKVHIGGVYYGAHNVGDEAILTGIINSFINISELSVSTYDNSWLKNKFPNVKTKLITSDYTKPKLGMYSLPRKNPIKSILNIYKDKKMYSNKNLYICGGATILSDCPWYSLRTVEIAKSSGIEAILFGVGMAELNDKDAKEYVKKVCNSINDVYVRDEYVKKRLTDIGVEEEKVKICYDAALILKPSNDINLNNYLSKNAIKKYNDECINIAVTLSGEEDVINRTSINEFVSVVKKWIKDYNANIFLIPTNTRKGQDIDLMRKLDIDEKIILIDKEFSPEDLIKFMSKFSFVLSSRLHMNILSSIVGTPSIGLVRNSKIIDFSKLLGLKYFSIDQLSINEIDEYARKLINNDDIRNNIINKVQVMKRRHMESAQEIINKYNLRKRE